MIRFSRNKNIMKQINTKFAALISLTDISNIDYVLLEEMLNGKHFTYFNVNMIIDEQDEDSL